MNKRLKKLISETGMPECDVKISAERVKERVVSAINAEPPERKRYMKYRIVKTAAAAACAASITA